MGRTVLIPADVIPRWQSDYHKRYWDPEGPVNRADIKRKLIADRKLMPDVVIQRPIELTTVNPVRKVIPVDPSLLILDDDYDDDYSTDEEAERARMYVRYVTAPYTLALQELSIYGLY